MSWPEIQGRRQHFIFETAQFGPPLRLLITTGREPRPLRGAQLELAGKLRAPRTIGRFNEQRWFEGQRVVGAIDWPTELAAVGPPSRFWGHLGSFRHQFLAVLDRTLPEPVASLAAGLSLGIQPEIDPAFAEALRRTNLTHLAAVSGQNLMIVVFSLFSFFRQFWLRAAMAIALVLLALYVALVGGEASVVRASLMVAVVILAPLVGRPVEPVRLLMLVATVMSLTHPLSLTRDVGFHLSFAALAGILLVGPFIASRLAFLHPWWANTIATVLAALLATLPVQLAIFGTLSLVGFLANLLAGLLIILAMPGVLILGLVGLISFPIGQMLAWFLYIPLEAIHQLALGFAGLPVAQVATDLPRWATTLLVSAELASFGLLAWGRLVPGRVRA